MKWMELAVHTTTESSDIISLILIQMGAEGTAIIDRADIPDPSKPHGYWELIDQALIDNMPEDVIVQGWFPMDQKLSERITLLQNALSELKRNSDSDMPLGSLKITQTQKNEEDWQECWKKYYKPFKAGKSLVIKPSWEEYTPQSTEKIIHIDPGMAFGTGTHETTSMCLALIEEHIINYKDPKVLDIGTGSGILAIGAALLGSKNILAIDIDPMAVKVAKENVALNNLGGVIKVDQGDLLSKAEFDYDICVANIIADIIILLAEPLKSRLAPNSIFICSGIIKEREGDVLTALSEHHYHIIEKRYLGEWVAIVCKPNN